MLNPTQHAAITRKLRRIIGTEETFVIVEQTIKITIEDEYKNRRFFEINEEGYIKEVE